MLTILGRPLRGSRLQSIGRVTWGRIGYHSSMDDSRPSKSRRPWLRFSLRALLVLVLLLSVPLGWFSWKMDRAREQREVVEGISELGGYIIYDYEFDETGELIWEAEPTTPAWLRKWLGDDFFCDVTRVGCSSTHFTDAELEHLKGLTNLKSLHLKSMQVTDAGLEHLKGLTNLKELWLLNTQATEDGVKKLQEALPDCEIIHARVGVNGGKERAMRHVGQPGWRFLLDRVGNKK